jgi:hypothetical protein
LLSDFVLNASYILKESAKNPLNSYHSLHGIYGILANLYRFRPGKSGLVLQGQLVELLHGLAEESALRDDVRPSHLVSEHSG